MKTTKNSGQFTSWHMERAGDNRYSKSDSTKQPAAGERSKTLVTDGRPAGARFDANEWFDGGPGNRGARASELAKYNGTSSERQSKNDAPFMKGDRARTGDGTLRQVRSDEKVSNNPTLKERAPELVAQFGDLTVGELSAKFGGLSLTQIGKLTQGERAKILARNEQNGHAQQGSLTSSLAQIMSQS